VGDKVRVAFVHPEQATPLPILASKQGDPPAEDPTMESTGAAALKSPPPQRSGPAPFVKQSLPDPYEYRPAAKIKNTPPEDAVPVTGTLQAPAVPVLPQKK
jgi:hypothetical protein